MAGNFLWDKQSPKPTIDVESPPGIVDSDASAIGNGNAPTRFSSKTTKLGLVVATATAAIAIGVVFGLRSKPNEGAAVQAAAASTAAQQNPEASTITSEYYISDGPLKAQVKMASPSIVNGYETCSDLERDINEALKLYMNEFILGEAVNNEIYASCDPENENWYADLYYDDDYFYNYDSNYACSPAAGNTTDCATDKTAVPWVVTWHVNDHAEGEVFDNETEALDAYDNVDSSWAKRLYDPSKTAVKEYGWMGGSDWCQLETWAYEAQCTGEAPAGQNNSALAKKTTKNLPKQARSGTPNSTEKQARSRTQNTPTRSGEAVNSFDQNNQYKDHSEQDKVVSDGVHVFTAYGDVLYAWEASDTTKGVSITHMPGEAFVCDSNSTEPCTTTTKPYIQALFLGNSRLTVIVSQSSWDNNTPENYIQPIITDYGTKSTILVFDTAVTLGIPLKEVGRKEFRGFFTDGRMIGNKMIIARESYIDTYAFTNDLSRYQDQYCGLDAASYKQLAAETAAQQVDSFAKQMVEELKLVNECSRIVQVSMLRSSLDYDPNSNAADILGRFVHVSSFDVNGEIALTSAGTFTSGTGYSMHFADDFLAIPSNVYEYNYTTLTASTETFILGFDLSTEDGAIPYCYGRIPGSFYNSYQMNTWGGHLRIATTDAGTTDAANGTQSTTHKIYVLEIPSFQDGPGLMTLVGETENLAEENDYYISGARFVEDQAYIFATNSSSDESQFIVVDLSDPSNLHVIGNLETVGSMSYLHPITINNNPYILGIGSQTNYSTWESFLNLSLFNMSNPSAPRLVASYREGGSGTGATYDFLAVRYIDSKLIIPVSKAKLVDEATTTYEFQEWFAVFGISEDTIALAFEVLHSKVDSYSYCYNDAEVPARSFVFQSALTTVKGHTVISSELESGTFISELDLDVGFNYSVCEPGSLYYYDYMYHYDDEVDGTANATDLCNLPKYVQADIVDSCSETEYTSRSWVFEPNSTYCDDSTHVEEVQSNVSSANECAQTCVEEHDGKDTSAVVGFWYGCDGKCVCLIEYDEAADSVSNTSAVNEGSGGCYMFSYPLSLAIMDPEGIDDDNFRC